MILDPTDPHYRAVMMAARAWGVPVSQFLGYSRAVTEHEYSGSGVLVRSTTASAWTDDDRANALALLDYEADCCPNCGGHLPETAAAQNEGKYDAAVRALCHRCVEIDILQNSETIKDAPHPRALLLGATLRPQEGTHDPSIPA